MDDSLSFCLHRAVQQVVVPEDTRHARVLMLSLDHGLCGLLRAEILRSVVTTSQETHELVSVEDVTGVVCCRKASLHDRS